MVLEDSDAILTDEKVSDLITNPEPWDFFRYCMIEHRDSKAWVPFVPSVEQEDWIRCLLGNKEAVDLKARNVGIGAATQVFHFWRAWRAAWLGTGLNTLVVAHSSDTAARHLERYKDLNARLPDELRLEVAKTSGGNNATDYKLIVPGSERDVVWFRCVTAGGKKGQGRGFTAQQAHLTEYAFYESDNYASLTGGMHQNSEWYSLAIESTPDPRETNPSFRIRYYASKRNREGSGDMVARFYAWPLQKSFRLPVPIDFERTKEEEALVRFAAELTPPVEVDDENLVWRRKKLGGAGPYADSTLKAFRKEYPLTEDEAFDTAKAEPYFPHASIKPFRAKWLDKPPPDPSGERIYAEVEPNMRYAVFLDVATGVGYHQSAISVVNARLEQVYAWSDADAETGEAADKAVDIAIHYNTAVLAVDTVGIGHAAYLRIKENGYRLRDPKMLMKPQSTHGSFQSQVMAYARLQLERGRPTVNDYATITELETMPPPAEMKRHMGRNRKTTGHWDNAVAFCNALWLAQLIDRPQDNGASQKIQERFLAARDAWDRYGVR